MEYILQLNFKEMETLKKALNYELAKHLDVIKNYKPNNKEVYDTISQDAKYIQRILEKIEECENEDCDFLPFF